MAMHNNKAKAYPLPPLPGSGEDEQVVDYRRLARLGDWKTLVSLIEPGLSALCQDEHRNSITKATYYFVALFKMREYSKIAAQIKPFDAVIRAGDTESLEGISEPRVPFVLLWIYAEYPIHLGQTMLGQDRLYRLLERSRKLEQFHESLCQNGSSTGVCFPLSDLEMIDTTSVGASSFVKAWARRSEMVVYILACHHCHMQQYKVSLKVLSTIAKGFQESSISILCYVLLQLGDVKSAKEICLLLQDKCKSSGSPLALYDNLQGLLSFACDDFQGAVQSFEKASSISESDPAAANNIAVGHMYARNLHVSIKLLEEKLSKNHQYAMHTPMVLNLCSMYELASTRCNESKKVLHTWILKHAPDDFNQKNTRLV